MRLAVSTCLAALLFAAGPALSQTATPTTPNIGGFPDSPPIPAPTNPTYPGVIRYEVDATDYDRHIVSVRQVIPVSGPRITLLYPKYLPGNHAASGPIQLLGGLIDGARPQVRAVGLGEWQLAEPGHVHDQDAHQREAAQDVQRGQALGAGKGLGGRKAHRGAGISPARVPSMCARRLRRRAARSAAPCGSRIPGVPAARLR